MYPMKIMFDDLSFTKFKVLYDGRVKYFGDLEKKECSCPGWMYKMKFVRLENSEKIESLYVKLNGSNYLCKHLIETINIRNYG